MRETSRLEHDDRCEYIRSKVYMKKHFLSWFILFYIFTHSKILFILIFIIDAKTILMKRSRHWQVCSMDCLTELRHRICHRVNPCPILGYLNAHSHPQNRRIPLMIFLDNYAQCYNNNNNNIH